MNDPKLVFGISNPELDATIDRFESAWSKSIDLADYLPDSLSADDTQVLCELIRVDMEFRWRAGLSPQVEDYLLRFTDVALSKIDLGNLAFEEYRLRQQYGAAIKPQQFASRLNIDVSKWPVWANDSNPSVPHSSPGRISPAVKFPAVGETFHDLELIAVLGKGAFGTVFLARQSDLANRFIAVKITTISDAEPQTLARLQHTNIVPIHSLRRDEALQSICMPFLGLVTMQDLFRQTQDDDEHSRSGQELISTVAGRRAETVVASTQDSDSDTTEIKKILQFDSGCAMPALDGMSYQETILWMTSRIADGLSFAHSRGVIHGDMKPGNVLISDDGQPLILDFHLSTPTHSQNEPSLVGGTLPFMSARHLATLSGRQSVDESCDIFSVGVMLYVALTGQLPYPDRGLDSDAIEAMIHDRSQPPRPVREVNSDVSPAAASIVEYCLAPNQHYPSAARIHVDIERHLASLPLKYAPNPSMIERFHKWANRHPRMSSVSAMLMLGVLAAAVAAMLIGAKLKHAASVEAIQQSKQFISQLQTARHPLTIGVIKSEYLHENSELLATLLASRTCASDDYVANLAKLPAEDFAIENAAVLDARYWLARSLLTLGINSESETKSQELLGRAIAEIDSAKLLSSSNPQALGQLQSEIYKQLGDTQRAATVLEESKNPTMGQLDSLPNLLLRAAEYRRIGDNPHALKVLESLVNNNPDSFPIWLMMGHCHVDLDKLEKAEACYTVCIGLEHESPWGYFCRGTCYLANREYELAILDFSKSIELNEDDTASYLNRALALRGMNQLDEAIQDLTSAIEMGCRETRAFYIRYQLRKQRGHQQQADDDLKRFLELTPEDEKSWNSRGMAQMIVNNPRAALADFKSALKTNSRSIDAFQNIATVQAEYLGQTLQAIAALSEIIEQQPQNVVAIATRGVLYGRRSDRKNAHLDAKLALHHSHSADTLYRVAGIYALTSKTHSHDSIVAVNLLRKAALANGRLVRARISNDNDLDPIREQAEFKELVATLELWILPTAPETEK